MTSLNPYLTVERQMTEVLEFHKGMSRKDARAKAVQALDAVKMPEAARRIAMYPHEFSGGMRQRVMIAMSLLCEPDVLIADEPTTALDVTVQAQILILMRELQRDFGTAIVMITHDLGVVAGLCDEVMVLYGGQVMEQGKRRGDFLQTLAPLHGWFAGRRATSGRRRCAHAGHSRRTPQYGQAAGRLPVYRALRHGLAAVRHRAACASRPPRTTHTCCAPATSISKT